MTDGVFHLDKVTCDMPSQFKACPYTFVMQVASYHAVQVNIVRVRHRQIITPSKQLMIVNPFVSSTSIAVTVWYESVLPIHDDFAFRLEAFENIRLNASSKLCQSELSGVSGNFEYSCQLKYTLPNNLISPAEDRLKLRLTSEHLIHDGGLDLEPLDLVNLITMSGVSRSLLTLQTAEKHPSVIISTLASNLTQESINHHQIVCRLGLMRHTEYSDAIQYNSHIDMKLTRLEADSYSCALDRPLTTLLPDDFRVSVAHLWLYVPNQNETLSSNIFILSLLKESPQIKRVSPVKLFQGLASGDTEVTIEMSFWDPRLSSHVLCHYEMVEPTQVKFSFTSNIVQLDQASGFIKCKAPTYELGNLKLSLIDVVNLQDLAVNYDLQVFEQLAIAADHSLQVYNESLSIQLNSDYNLNKILDVNISCLLNNRTLGRFKVTNKRAHCEFSYATYSALNKLELVTRQLGRDNWIITQYPAFFEMMELPQFSLHSKSLNFFHKSPNEPLRIKLLASRDYQQHEENYMISNMECWIEQRDQDRNNPRRVPGVLMKSPHSDYVCQFGTFNQRNSPDVIEISIHLLDRLSALRFNVATEATILQIQYENVFRHFRVHERMHQIDSNNSVRVYFDDTVPKSTLFQSLYQGHQHLYCQLSSTTDVFRSDEINGAALLSKDGQLFCKFDSILGSGTYNITLFINNETMADRVNQEIVTFRTDHVLADLIQLTPQLIIYNLTKELKGQTLTVQFEAIRSLIEIVEEQSIMIKIMNQTYKPSGKLTFTLPLSDLVESFKQSQHSDVVPLQISLDSGLNYIQSERWAVRFVLQDMRIQIASQSYAIVGSIMNVTIRHDREVVEVGRLACLQNDERQILASRINETTVQCEISFMRTGNHTLRLVDLDAPLRFTSNYVFIQAFPVAVPSLSIRDRLPRLSTSDFDMLIKKIYPLRVPRVGKHNITFSLGGILSETASNLHCLIRDQTGYFTSIGRMMRTNSFLITCEYLLDLDPQSEYSVSLSPNGYEDIQTECDFKLIVLLSPLIQSVSPIYLFGNEYNQNLTIKGLNFRDDVTLQILSEWKLPIYELSTFLSLSENELNVTVPANSFQLDRNFLRLTVGESHIQSNALALHVLKSINFLGVQPRIGIQGIENIFYIVMDNFYENLRLSCAFHTKNSWTRKPIVVESDVSMLDQRLIRCILPKNYSKRGFNKQDDEVILKVSVDGQNWIKMGTLNVVTLETHEITPTVIEYGGSRQIQVRSAQLTRDVFDGEQFLCSFLMPNLTFTKAIVESDSVIKCSIPFTNESMAYDLSLPVWLSTNQDNLKYVGEVIIKKGIEVHNTSLKFLRRAVPLRMIVRGANLDYTDLELKYQLYDYANNPIEEGRVQIIDRFNSTSILILVPPLMSSLALRADFRFERSSVAIKSTRAQFTILLIDTPMIENGPVNHQLLGRLEPLVMSGMNLFNELDLECFINGTEEVRSKVTQVNKTHMLCPLSTQITLIGQYQFMVYARGIDLQMNLLFPVMLNVHTQPVLQRTSPHYILQTHPESLKLQLFMDQVMDAPFIKGSFVARFSLADGGEVFSPCMYEHSNRRVLDCNIPEFDSIGTYLIAYSYDGGSEFTETQHTLQVQEDPVIYDVSPRVFLKHTEYDITITGRNFDPRVLRAVWIGQYKASYIQVDQNQLKLKSPVLSTVENIALDVKIETLYPEIFSNAQQIIFTNSLNVSSVSRSILFSNTGVQKIDLIGSQFRKSLNYSCLLAVSESQMAPLMTVRARYRSQSVLECPIDTSVLTKVSDDYYSLWIQLNAQSSYLLTTFTVLSPPFLESFAPAVLYSDSGRFNLQLKGQWSYLSSLQMPLVKIHTRDGGVTLDVVEGRYNKSAPAMFIHANVSGGHGQEWVQYSVSQDGGRTWSNNLTHRLLQKPVITKFTPSYFEIKEDREEYLIGVHGQNFDPRMLECFINDKYKLSVMHFNSTYIECGWRDFHIQKRYVLSVSTNGGQQFVYSYNLSLTFMTFPRILRVHPSTVPNNRASLVLLEFNKTSLHDLEHLRVGIGQLDYNMSMIQLVNQTFVQIQFNPSIQMSRQRYPIRLLIDPSTDSEYDSGQVLEVGGALLYDRILIPIVFQNSYQKGLTVVGTNLVHYLSPNTTWCNVGGLNYSIEYMPDSNILCKIPLSELSVGYHDLQVLVDHIEFHRFNGDFLVLPSPTMVETLTLLNSSFVVAEGSYHYTNGSQCVFWDLKNKFITYPQQFGCTNNNGIKYCNQSLCQVPEDLQGKNQTLKFHLDSYQGSISSLNFSLNAKTVPTIVQVQERLILADTYENESLIVTFEKGPYEHSVIFCKFIEESQDGTERYSLSQDLSGKIIACPIPSNLRQSYDHSLELSFDNLSYSEPYLRALQFLPNLRVRSVTPDYVLPDMRETREFSVLMSQNVYDNANLSCIIISQNRTIKGVLRTAGNYQYYKCEVPTRAFEGESQFSIAVVYSELLVPQIQSQKVSHDVRVIPRPLIVGITPQIVLNEKMPPVMKIEGSSLEWYSRVIFKHSLTHETQVISTSNTSLSVKLPSMHKTLKEPRWVEVTLVVDDDNSFTLRQRVQYIPQLLIQDFTLHDDRALIQIDSYLLDIHYYCTFGIAALNSFPLRVRALQSENILACPFGNLDYDSRFDQLRVEYFLDGQRQLTNIVQINRVTNWQLLGHQSVHQKGILLVKQLDNQGSNIEQAFCNINISQITYLSKLQSFESQEII